MSVPTITVTGRLGRDPEIRTTKNGKQVANLFVIADTSRKNPQTGAWDKTDTWSCGVTAFNDLAAACTQIGKGMLVTITGRLRHEEYATDDGQKHTAQKIIATDIAVSLNGQNVQVTKRNAPQAGFTQALQANQFPPQANAYQPAPAGDPWGQNTYGGGY